MKSRLTFIRPHDGPFDPKQVKIGTRSVLIRSLKAAREERLTVGLEELPQEAVRVLQQCHQFHLRWVSQMPYPSIAPFLSRLSSGLHLLFTPQSKHPTDLLDPLLQKVLGKGIQCTSNSDKFISMPASSSRFSSSSAFQCYEGLPSLKDFAVYVEQEICPKNDSQCLKRADHLQRADYLDIDYDAISRSLTLTSFHRAPPESEHWEEKIKPYESSARTEVGVLTSEKATDPEELSMEGFLTVIGEDREPNPTRFSFPSRHHTVPPASGSSFSTTFPPPTGLHPTLRLTFPSSFITPPAPSCALHTYLTLPSSLFIDKYQLSSSNFLASKNLRGIRALSGETDLEAPDWVIGKWGSALLLELAPAAPSQTRASERWDTPWHADIPLHLRYLSPTAGGKAEVDVPWPVVFWACPAEEGTKMNVNPFDRVDLGYESLFGPRTMFYHFQPKPAVVGGRLSEQIMVPVMDLEGTIWVESGTVGVVVLGALWVVWKLLRILVRDWRVNRSQAVEEKKTQ